MVVVPRNLEEVDRRSSVEVPHSMAAVVGSHAADPGQGRKTSRRVSLSLEYRIGMVCESL